MRRLLSNLTLFGVLFVGYGMIRQMQPTEKMFRPHQLGWLRRPELESHREGQVWELPDGKLYVHRGRDEPRLVRIPRKQSA